MLASIHSGSSTKVWPEILHESERRQCTLFIFPGGRLASHDEYEYMRNGIFDLACGRGFDGVVSWASSLSGFASEKQVEDFLLSRIDVPLVTFGLKIGETPVVNIDTYSGMKQLVSHLAKRHKRKRKKFFVGKLHSYIISYKIRYPNRSLCEPMSIILIIFSTSSISYTKSMPPLI